MLPCLCVLGPPSTQRMIFLQSFRWLAVLLLTVFNPLTLAVNLMDSLVCLHGDLFGALKTTAQDPTLVFM